MRKYIVLALLLLVMASGAFALDSNIGLGAGFNYASTYGTFDDYGYSEDWEMLRSGVYFFAFYGFNRFFEVNLGIMLKQPQDIIVEGESYGDAVLDDAIALQFGIYGKYPFPLGSRFVLFPTLGVDFELSFSNGSDIDYMVDWWHDLWLRGGIGMDVFITERLFLRGHLLYGAALAIGGDPELGTSWSQGFLGKLGVGWMLY